MWIQVAGLCVIQVPEIRMPDSVRGFLCGSVFISGATETGPCLISCLPRQGHHCDVAWKSRSTGPVQCAAFIKRVPESVIGGAGDVCCGKTVSLWLLWAPLQSEMVSGLSPGDGHSTHICASLVGQLAAGTCEIVTLDRDSSQPRRTIARQTARCACRKGQIAGTTRARPACVDGKSPWPRRPH